MVICPSASQGQHIFLDTTPFRIVYSIYQRWVAEHAAGCWTLGCQSYCLTNPLLFLLFGGSLQLSMNHSRDDREQLEAGLYLVSTPIGNLEDITLRALRILREADLIAAEDTRRTANLLKVYQIEKPLTSYYDHNKERRAPQLAQEVRRGKRVALVSDAGTPGISDPAYYLVRIVLREGMRVIPIPGPSAPIAALQVSGLPPDRFAFEGYLPRKKGKREKRLRELREEERTIILFEAPHRLLDSLRNILEILGDRKAAICRELTKKFEEVLRGRVSELIEDIENRKPRGELVIVLEGGCSPTR